ncbi:MAG: hypothetical protein O3C28_18250 [Proteobacteria bacterium]|nr:hypothetical protein [Pseudomonadota bacterium]
MNVLKRKPAQRTVDRISRNLRIRRINVEVAGLVVHTSNVSRDGAQLVCPAIRYPALEKQFRNAPFELVIELPTERDITTYANVRYSCPCDDEYLIGVSFDSFRDGDAAGWYSYMDWVCSPSPIAV